jgi:hypothetical protein
MRTYGLRTTVKMGRARISAIVPIAVEEVRRERPLSACVQAVFRDLLGRHEALKQASLDRRAGGLVVLHIDKVEAWREVDQPVDPFPPQPRPARKARPLHLDTAGRAGRGSGVLGISSAPELHVVGDATYEPATDGSCDRLI